MTGVEKMNKIWSKKLDGSWFIFNENTINKNVIAGREGVYVIFTNYNNIPIAHYVGRGQIKHRLGEYTLYNPMRARRVFTNSLCVTWTYIPDENEQCNAEAYLIQNLYPLENKQRPLPMNPYFTIELPW